MSTASIAVLASFKNAFNSLFCPFVKIGVNVVLVFALINAPTSLTIPLNLRCSFLIIFSAPRTYSPFSIRPPVSNVNCASNFDSVISSIFSTISLNGACNVPNFALPGTFLTPVEISISKSLTLSRLLAVWS